jgi:hypothetical protein
VGYEFVLNCVFCELLDDLLINNLGLQDIFFFKKKGKIKEEKKKIILSFSLSNRASCLTKH